MTLTAITGGIGSGKSVISRVLSAMGYPVFDCDREAKLLMDTDNGIKRRLTAEISPAAVSEDGTINRACISSIVFSDEKKLRALNDIVHSAVRDRLKDWCNAHSTDKRLFVETAILYQSGLDRMVDNVWEVIAPEEIRIMRVMNRNSCDRADVESRIASQNFIPDSPHSHVDVITNDGFLPVLPQIIKLL